ncbi:MAG: sulfotransferase family protein [Caulobacter vibrioides]|uniref:Sulfotransferase family protein n=1 Tax=Caulobacter vibrioides TaxID=155892 RepID=A0A258CU51_CAUVI|nr:MAG: sulfotransferase family protein [Caulobacter vibrioides]
MTSPASTGERDALLQEARNLRVNKRVHDALTVLARLQALYPRFSRLYQERGHCHVLLQDVPAAIAALQDAVSLNPTLPACWDMLEQLYRMLGDTAQAAKAAQNLSMLRQLPPEIVVANSLFADGDLAPAEDVLRDYLRKDGQNVGALRLLARICKDREAPGDAEALLEEAIELTPDYHEARLDYAIVLLQQQKHLQARQQAECLLRYDPGNREYLKQYGAACVGLGDHEPVIDLYAGLLEGSLAASPDYGVAWFGLANLKTYRFTDDEIARMRAAEAHPDTQDMDRIYLCFALGKAFEDRGEYASSWHYYEHGNAARHLSSRFRPEVAETCVDRLKQTFTAEFLADRSGWGVDDPAPIFVLGLPRSGSTLLEQILASHSLVEGTQELTEISRYAREICGSDPDCNLPLNPQAMQRLTAGDARALGQRFLAETRTYRRLGRPFFIDKMPNNFWHIGLIHLILPRSTIIDIRREPMACGFSNFKQLFGTNNQEFAYEIDDFARYYRAYLDLMRHWDTVLPGRVLRVQYEDLVEDLEGSVKRMLDHCGLSFDPACLAFHRTKRSVRTPSSEQVRQPLGREGLTQWQNYTPWLAPLREALGDALTGYRN